MKSIVSVIVLCGLVICYVCATRNNKYKEAAVATKDMIDFNSKTALVAVNSFFQLSKKQRMM